MTFRARLVLATTVAVVVAVLAASLASFLVARNTLLQATDNSLTTAAQRIVAGQEIGSTTATLGQVTTPGGAVVSGGGLPVTGQVRLVATAFAPAYFTTVTVDGNQMRELVEHLPAGTAFESGILLDGGALQIATLLNASSELRTLAILLGVVAFIGVLLAVVLGWLVARTALVPLNSLTDTVEDLAETTDVTRRLSPGGPDELGRLRRTFNRLLEALESSRRAQSQLVLDASHELRTPLTSLRTNLEVIRRVDELSVEDRSVLVDDVLVQLQELTDLVGDLAELARGDQQPAAAEPLRLDLLVRDAVAVQSTHGRAQDVTFELDAEPCWVEGHAGPHRPRRRQPARQRPQVEPARPDRVGRVPRGRRSWCTTAARVSPRRTCPTSSTASTAPRPPGGCPGPASAWPSWPRSSRPRAGPSRPRTIPGRGPDVPAPAHGARA